MEENNIDLIPGILSVYLPIITDESNKFYNLFDDNNPHKDIIFVFGSNLAGRHGKGAALTAKNHFGAKYGVGRGLQGRSYGIPTKGFNLEILPLHNIKNSIQDFVMLTQSLKYCFYVTPLATGLAGYTHKNIAPMFKGVKRCWLPNIWKEYIE